MSWFGKHGVQIATILAAGIVILMLVGNMALVYYLSEKGENYTTLTVPGSPGNTGPQGPRGPQGEPGSNGLNGQVGASGTNGTNGTNGNNGLNGVSGETGPEGPQGVPGIQGPDGRGVQMGCVDNQISWRPIGDEQWISLGTLCTDDGGGNE